VGVDIGGTFTDLVLLEEGRVLRTAKTPTTHDDPSLGVRVGLESLFPEGASDDVEVVHGTTLVSNALIERKGVRTGLVSTLGFKDLLDIRREHRYDLYDLFIEIPAPLVGRQHRYEVEERIFADGTVDIELTREAAERLAEQVRADGLESLAVSLLHAYRFPDHERLIRDVLREKLADLPVSLSSDVAPELGEYERASTVAANAYVQPLVDSYLGTLEGRLKEVGVHGSVYIMLSTGGLATVSTARQSPVLLCESGPAAGVLAAGYWGAKSGETNVLAFDMGGTTAKVSLIHDGKPMVTRNAEVARVHRFAKGSGLPLRVPVIDMLEVGAGGGSIARLNEFGLPKVGPDSTGSEPGPACYARGGTHPTVTDADLLLGYLDPDYFLGGAMRLDVDAASRAVSELAGALSTTEQEAAAAIHRVVNENMAAAARIHSIERGLDLRKFTLIATGGAAPIHAWGMARALRMRSILFPPFAGVASALGLLTASPSFDFVRTLPQRLLSVSWPTVHAMVAEMTAIGVRSLAEHDRKTPLIAISADVRHSGQGETITVVLGPALGADPPRQLAEAFERVYVRVYGRRPAGVEIEVVSWRVRVSAPTPIVAAEGPRSPRSMEKRSRRVWSPDRREVVEAAVIDRYGLEPGDQVEGPAVVEERESSVVIGVGGTARVDEFGSLRVDVGD
jgi:N-methylhydantoinase A